MTEIHNNDLASIVAALTELTQKVEAIRGGENAAPTLDPNDPLNEISQDDWRATDANDSEEERANNILRESGEPRTIRNFLKALMRKPSADSWYTVRSLGSRKYYRISLVSEENRNLTKPDGSVLRQTRTHDFTLPVPPEELTAGWTIRAEAKVLDVFEMDDKKYAIYEMLS